MDFMNSYLLGSVLSLNLHITISADWQVQLGNLVVLRVVRVEVILSVKLSILRNLTIGSKSYGQSILYDLLV